MIGKIMSAHDDRGFLKDFLRLGFFRRKIEEKDIVIFFKQMGWEYKICSLPEEMMARVEPKDQFELYMCSIKKTGEVHSSVKCNSSTRVFWAVKLLIEERHRRYSKSKGIASLVATPDQIEMLSMAMAAISVVPPAEMLKLYSKNMKPPTVEDVVQELNVITPIAILALDLFAHYYPHAN